MTENTISASDIRSALVFFEKAYPSPSDRNFHTQLGCHFEEIAEMVEQLKGRTRVTQALLTQLLLAATALSAHLKGNQGVIEVVDPVGFLDGLCDQLVTATGTGYMASMDITGAFGEVNSSNLSKFGDNGEPILDNNLKLTKGPNYFKPNLKPFASVPPDCANPA